MDPKSPENKDTFPLARVEWVDSCEPADNSEIEEHEIPEVQLILQVGFLIKETERSVSIAGAWKPDLDTFDYVITIPRSAINSINILSGKGGPG